MIERPDLNGLRVCFPYHYAIYMMDEGKKRWIPSPQVYTALFVNQDQPLGGMIRISPPNRGGVIRDSSIADISNGSDIPDTAILFKYYDNSAVFLLDGQAPNHVKRLITSPAVMNHYGFNWEKIQVWNMPIASSNILDGNPITNPPGVIEFPLDHSPKTNTEITEYNNWRALL